MKQEVNWQKYWDKYLKNRYGKEEIETEDDLYCQVARTVDKKPIDKKIFDLIISQISQKLSLSYDNILVDFCCGNGLFTYELRNLVKQIIGIDFSENIICTAIEYKNASNINYCMGGVIDYMKTFKEEWPGIVPNKYLMNDSLAYFTSADLENLLTCISMLSKEFMFLTRGVPNEDLMWNYYNTEERKKVYFSNLAKGDLTNGGLGSWWSPKTIEDICKKLNLGFVISMQDIELSDYRMDIIIQSK